MKHSEDSHFSWKIGVIIGVAILVIAGVTLGLIFGLSGGKNVEGVYVWESNLPKDITSYSHETVTFTTILRPDKSVVATSDTDNESSNGTYTVEDNKISIAWDENKNTTYGLDIYAIVDGNLIDKQSHVWIKQ